jgi:RNA-binding protein
MSNPPALTTKQVSFLRSKAHKLEPVVRLGKSGATDGVKKELEIALARHELVKVRTGRFVELDAPTLATSLGAVVVQELGHVLVLYRPAAEPKLSLPS